MFREVWAVALPHTFLSVDLPHLWRRENTSRQRHTLVSMASHCLALKAHVGRIVWMKLFCKRIQCSELLGWFLLLPEKYPFEFKSQNLMIIWPCLYCEVNSNVLKSNLFSLVPECKAYILLLSCWITSIANTFRSFLQKIHLFHLWKLCNSFILGDHSMHFKYLFDLAKVTDNTQNIPVFVTDFRHHLHTACVMCQVMKTLLLMILAIPNINNGFVN